MSEQCEYIKDNLTPTFLFTWQGKRRRDEGIYGCHDFPEIGIIMSGKMNYLIDDEVYTLEEGDILLLNPGVKHKALVQNAENPAVEFFVGYTDVNFEGMEPNHFSLGDNGPVYHTQPDLRLKIFKLCDAIKEENAELRPGRYYMLRTYLEQLLLLLIREEAKPMKRNEGYSFESVNKKYAVEQIINYFEEHYSEKISLDQIAENMYLSPFYISKIFKSETGDTPIRHLINIRLERAKKLLEEGKVLSIQEVAMMVGYDDAYHFSKLYKKRYGMPPSQSRLAKE